MSKVNFPNFCSFHAHNISCNQRVDYDQGLGDAQTEAERAPGLPTSQGDGAEVLLGLAALCGLPAGRRELGADVVGDGGHGGGAQVA